MSRADGDLEVLWHEVECAPYAADLPLWRELAGEAAGPVLELGCGTGRVALALAGAGVELTAIDRRPALVAELRARAAAAGLEIDARVADARDLGLGRPFELVIAPMQLVHLLGGPAGRRAALERVRTHLGPGGRFCAAVLTDDALAEASVGAPPPLPDVREVDGWVYSSLPIEVRPTAAGVEVRRLRQVVSPGGVLEEQLDATRLDRLSVAELEREAAGAGYEAVGRAIVPPTADHVGSTVVTLEAR